MAVCGNHLHLLVRGLTREELQNFFRVFAGHVAQQILNLFPLSSHKIAETAGFAKNKRKFWQLLIYSRVVSWGRDFKYVAGYIYKNTLEALNIIA